MDEIEKNTVRVEEQLSEEQKFYRISEIGKKKILIVGNSITRHAPKPEIGWVGDFGMAASERKMDYVHRLLEFWNGKYAVAVRQCADWEKDYLKFDYRNSFSEARNFCADLLIFRLGENVRARKELYFAEALDLFLREIAPEKPILFTTCFWKNMVVDKVIREAADRRKMPCVELGDLGEQAEMKALGKFYHTGVANHPGDFGMAKIAERIARELDNWEIFSNYHADMSRVPRQKML